MKRSTPPARCYFCNKFISNEVSMKNWKLIQAPGVADPEPYEIMWCEDCKELAND